jgi:hypothetical protein
MLKLHVMKKCGEVEVKIHTFLTRHWLIIYFVALIVFYSKNEVIYMEALTKVWETKKY